MSYKTNVTPSPLIRGNLPCPAHGGTDSVGMYEGVDGQPDHWHCFNATCGAHGVVDEKTKQFFEENAVMDSTNSKPTPLGLITGGKSEALDKATDPWGFRGISRETCEAFGVKIWVDDQGNRNLVLPYYDERGNLIAQKVRRKDIVAGKKNFQWYKAHDTASKEITFFGQQRANPSPRNKILTVVCGELDALATMEMMGDWPVISIPNGDQSAKTFFSKYYTYLDKWDTIVYIPDNDDSGKATVQDVSQMFMRKIKVVKLTKYKDPNEYLQHGEVGAFKDLWWSAQPYMPDKILSLGEIMHDTLFTDPPKPIAPYFVPSMDEALGGIYPSDIILVLAPSGAGKTTFTTTIAHHILQTTDLKIGLVYLEETKRDLAFRFVTLDLQVNTQKPGVVETISKETLHDLIKKYTAEEKVYVVDHGDTCSTEFIEQKFRELVLARGCQVIVFDHISMAIADESNKDERIALDRALYAIRALMQGGIQETKPDGTLEEYHPSLIMVSHVNDQGRSRGSRAAEQVANVVLSLERDRKASTKEERNLTTVWCSKNRRLGVEGPVAMLYYNSTTGCFEDRSHLISGDVEDDTPVMDKVKKDDGSFKYAG
jgi:twinkle protein